jgi:glucose dehydrogenase/plastocyanin
MERSSRSTLHRCVILIAITAAALTYSSRVLQSDEDWYGFPGADWLLVGGDWTSARYSTLDQINLQSVSRLSGAWTKRFGGGASTRATPVVKAGVMFTPAGGSVHAIDAKSGKGIWEWRSQEGLSDTSTAIDAMNDVSGQALPNVAGVALGDGLVFVGMLDGTMVALRQRTGELVWKQRIGEALRKKGESVAAAPIYARGMVFAGLANGDWAMRGRIVALDATSGKKLWEFFTVPAPGEFGHETWPKDNKAWETGGGGVWQTGALDNELGLVYFVTGNAVPMYGGEIRKGDNLFTASIVALDMVSGRMRWFYQVVHHDLWDADIATPPLLYALERDGHSQMGLAAIRADGYVFLMNRDAGKPLFPVEERPVSQDRFLATAATQPFPVGADSLLPGCAFWKDKIPKPFVIDCTGFAPPYVNKHNVVAPNVPIPGVRVTPMSYSPQTGFIYAQGVARLGRARRLTDDPWFQGAGGSDVTLPESIGIFAAIDVRSNKIVWKKEGPAPLLGTSGPLTTAGGLVFRASANGSVEAYNARTGDRVWTFRTGARSARGPAMTYAVDGEQYVALSMGPELWAFKLGGTIAEAPERPASTTVRGTRTDEIETATLKQVSFGGAVGRRYAVDEHAFNPDRALVKAGTRVMFVNNGRLNHTLAARDRSWNSGDLRPGGSYYVLFDKPGTHLYHCTNHPWAIGEVTVEP